MGKQSKRENKTIYQLCREECGLTRDGKITDDEIKDFALISKKLNDISLAVDALNLWVDKTASENNINIKLLNEEMKKIEQ